MRENGRKGTLFRPGNYAVEALVERTNLRQQTRFLSFTLPFIVFFPSLNDLSGDWATSYSRSDSIRVCFFFHFSSVLVNSHSLYYIIINVPIIFF